MQDFRDKFRTITRKKLSPVEREKEVRRLLAELRVCRELTR